MKQETGSNTNLDRGLSIQLRLDGDSFSLESYRHLMADCSDGEVDEVLDVDSGEFIENTTSLSGFMDKPIHLLSHRTVLAPLCDVQSRGAEAILFDCGVDFTTNDTIITIERDQNVAIISISKSVYEQIISTFGKEAPFTSPLLRTSVNSDCHIVVYAAQGLTYINIYNRESMIFAEVFLTPSQSDTLYWLSRIGEHIPLDNYVVYVSSSDSSLVDVLSRYYNRVEICE